MEDMMAERVGFEPTVHETCTPVFETGTLNHSDTSPLRKARRKFTAMPHHANDRCLRVICKLLLQCKCRPDCCLRVHVNVLSYETREAGGGHMATKDQELESIGSEMERRETGVADLMELYEKVEDVYVRASASIADSRVTYTSDSTNVVEPHAYIGQDSR